MAPDADRMHVLTLAPPREMAEEHLRPELRGWFADAHGIPTKAQRLAWPIVQRGQHMLVCAPTGSGKTLAAFLPILSEILDERRPGLQCLYVAPLKALVRDVRINLKRSWRGLQQAGFFPDIDLRIGLRTGDTAQRVRQRQFSDPPTILLTTPESLAQMLAHPQSHSGGDSVFRSLRWIVVDEIHALAGNKRGADLAISLERLAHRNAEEDGPQRIGLSATCASLSALARFLVGAGRSCAVAQVADTARAELVVEPLCEEYEPGWMAKLLDRLDQELTPWRTTLIFTNARSLAERLTWALRRRYPDRAEEIGVHHSSLSPARRRAVERRLKQGRLWAVVSSTSLELGIDIGAVDSVVFVHPPGGVARLLQRVGRSGHRPDQPRRGVLLTASPAELLESVVTVGSSHAGQLEAVRGIDRPLDVLCQQLVGMAMTGAWLPRDAYDLICRAAPYRDLPWADFTDCLDYLSGRLRDGTRWLPARLRWEADAFTIADERTARLLRRNLGTILTEDACAIRLRVPVTLQDSMPLERGQRVGEIDNVYADRLQPGDRFVLDGRCLEMKEREESALMVDEVFGRPQIPRWLGGGVPVSAELARRIYLFRVQAAEALRDGDDSLRTLLDRDFHLDGAALASLADYLIRQETVSEIPALTTLLIECMASQSCQEYCIHTPLPRSANEVLARVIEQRWQGPLLATAADLGIHLLAHQAEPMSPDAWRACLRADGFAEDFRAYLESSELLRDHFARVAQTGLMVLRHPHGRKRKVGGKDWTSRRLYDQIRTRMPDFPLLRQTEHEARECLCDLPAASAFAASVPSLMIRVRNLAELSPFGESLLRFR